MVFFNCASSWSRTNDLILKRDLLYQLSYGRMSIKYQKNEGKSIKTGESVTSIFRQNFIWVPPRIKLKKRWDRFAYLPLHGRYTFRIFSHGYMLKNILKVLRFPHVSKIRESVTSIFLLKNLATLTRAVALRLSIPT